MDLLQSCTRWTAESFRYLPTNSMSRLWGKFSRSAISKRAVRGFAWIWGIDVSEAEFSADEYSNLNEFFTRRLKNGLRPVDSRQSIIVSPVDGRIVSQGVCDRDQMLQVKGINYSLYELLGDEAMARTFENGAYMTTYLSPHDYHHIHAPLDLRMTGYSYVPGRLLPVNPSSLSWIHGLYTNNERLILFAASPTGSLALVMVGANCVGSIRLSFADVVTNQAGRGPTREHFSKAIKIRKGQELAVFEMGSTVVLILEPKHADFDQLQAGMSVRMGEAVGTIHDKIPANSKTRRRRR